MNIVTVVNKVSSESIPIELADFMGMDDKLKILVLYGNHDENLELAKEINLTTDIVSVELKSLYKLGQLKKIRKNLTELKPDVIHVHHTMSGFLARMIAKRIGNIKIVTTIHNNLKHSKFYQLFTYALNLNNSDKIICNSINTSKSFPWWLNLFINKKKKMVIYNGVNVNRILKQDKPVFLNMFNIDPSIEFLIGNTSRLIPLKDHETLINAFAIFRKKLNKGKLILIGDGILRKKLENFANQLSIREHVIFTGSIVRDDVYSTLNSLDLFVMSSVSEGFCNALVEAMIAGIPSIISNIETLKEVTGGNENALNFPLGDHIKLAEKMIYLYENPEEAEKIAQSGKTYSMQNLSLEACAENYKNIYKDLIS